MKTITLRLTAVAITLGALLVILAMNGVFDPWLFADESCFTTMEDCNH